MPKKLCMSLKAYPNFKEFSMTAFSHVPVKRTTDFQTFVFLIISVDNQVIAKVSLKVYKNDNVSV